MRAGVQLIMKKEDTTLTDRKIGPMNLNKIILFGKGETWLDYFSS